jgi:hypothetical protein
MNNVVENVIASIFVIGLTTATELILQHYFGFSVQDSLIVSGFVLLVLVFLFLAARRFYPVWRKLLNSSIIEFPNQDACESKIQRAFRDARRKVKILTIRGEKYFSPRGLFQDLYLPIRTKNCRIEVLVLSPESDHITDELARELGQGSARAIRQKMRDVLEDFLKPLASQKKNFEVKCYDGTPIFKILLFDDTMFVSVFTEPQNDRYAKMLQIAREHPLFTGFERYFEDLWKRSVPPK